jgi:flagellar basal-body rod protein FlgB
MSRSLFPHTVDVLQKNMELRLSRHQVLTSNVANAETPGYVAKDVTFEAELRDATLRSEGAAQEKPGLHRTHARHFSMALPQVRDVQGTVTAALSDDVGRDLNSVSIDQEMGKLTTNTFHYNASAELLSRTLQHLKHAISEGGR